MHKPVTLNIATTGKGNNKTWESTYAHAGGPQYWYQFKGGNIKDNGDQLGDANGSAGSFDIRFAGNDAKLYRFLDFWSNPKKDPDTQLSGTVSDDGETLTVTNRCTSDTVGMVYGAKVCPVSDEEHWFICDPVISNKQVIENLFVRLLRALAELFGLRFGR